MSSPRNNPLISIGMPIWNCATTVACSVESILNQSYKNWELLISDNCSNDGTFEIVKSLTENDQRVKLVQQTENKGGWPNFLFVFDKSSADYFKFHAGDDYLSEKYLESIVIAFQEYPDSAGVCTPDIWDKQNKETDQGNRFELVGSQEFRLNKLRKYCWKSNGVFYGVYKRTALNRAITPDLFESKIQILDWLILARILKEGSIRRTNSGLLILGSNGASNSNPFTWFNQLGSYTEKALPYRGFGRLFKEGNTPVSWRTKLIVHLWVVELILNHFKGLVRLALDRTGIRRYSQ